MCSVLIREHIVASKRLLSMPAKTISSQLAVSPSFGPEIEKRGNLAEAKQSPENCDMSPRSSLEIDRVSDHTKGGSNKHALPEVPIKKVSFTASEQIPSGTQHTEETISTIREEHECYYDCDEEVEQPDYDDVEYDDDDDHSDDDHSDDEHSETNHGEEDGIPSASPVSASDAKMLASPTTKNRRRRKIRWSGQVRVQEIRHINNMPESEIDAVWMSPIEYKAIKNGAKTTVLMMMAGETFHEDDPDFCSRGLEFRTRKGNKIRAANKLKARSAVLNEQDLQRDEGFHDPEFIAMASLDVSFECREQAQKRGGKDAEAIVEYLSDVNVLFS